VEDRRQRGFLPLVAVTAVGYFRPVCAAEQASSNKSKGRDSDAHRASFFAVRRRISKFHLANHNGCFCVTDELTQFSWSVSRVTLLKISFHAREPAGVINHLPRYEVGARKPARHSCGRPPRGVYPSARLTAGECIRFRAGTIARNHVLPMDSAAASFRSTCDSVRGPPESNTQLCPAATPHVGQGTDSNCSGVSSFFFIRTECKRIGRKTVLFGTFSGLAAALKATLFAFGAKNCCLIVQDNTQK
jgi:hypothetical protein